MAEFSDFDYIIIIVVRTFSAHGSWINQDFPHLASHSCRVVVKVEESGQNQSLAVQRVVTQSWTTSNNPGELAGSHAFSLTVEDITTVSRQAEAEKQKNIIA